MEFILFICTDPTAPKYVAEEDNIEDWVADLDERGVSRGGDRLRPAADATTVLVRDDQVIIADGPFEPTAGAIVGYDLIDCAGLDEAIEIAVAHPMARFGKVEIRAIWPLEL